MPTRDRVEIVRFSGGQLSGLMVEAPLDLAAQLPFMKLALTAAGQLLDVESQCRLRDVRVLRLPGDYAVVPAPAVPAAAAPPTPEAVPVPVAATAPAPPRKPVVSMAPMFLAARPAQ